MPRNVTSNYLGALLAAGLRPALFVEMRFANENLYVWSGVGTVNWGDRNWIGVGTLGSISTIEEGCTVEARGITLHLSGIDQTSLGDVLVQIQQGLRAIVYLGLYDDSSPPVLIADPVVSFAGRMDQPTISLDGRIVTISINCENRLVDLNVATDRRLTNEDQQLDHPGDRGLEFVNSIQEQIVYWGVAPNGNNL